MVNEHEGDYASQWEAIRSIAEKIGCSPESLRKWLRRTEVDSGLRAVALRRSTADGTIPPEDRVHFRALSTMIVKTIAAPLKRV